MYLFVRVLLLVCGCVRVCVHVRACTYVRMHVCMYILYADIYQQQKLAINYVCNVFFLLLDNTLS